MKLTSLECKKAQPKDKPYKISDGGGLYLEVMPNGNRHWRMKYRIRGIEKRISLGRYPDMSLVEARNHWHTERKKIQIGVDPLYERQEEKLLHDFKAANSFEEVAREWHQIMLPRWTAKHAGTIMYRMEKDLFPYIGHIPIADLRAPVVIACLRKIEARNAHDLAKRNQQMCGQVMRYAVQTGRIERNFIPDLRGALISRPSTPFAAISPDEIPELLAAIEHNKPGLYRQTILAIKLMMLTFVRTNELIRATWNEFNFDKAEWIIPAERMKMRRTHVVPLSTQSLAILTELKQLNGKREHVFPHIAYPRRPMCSDRILNGVETLGFKGRMTGHGFRALAMTTIKEKLSYRHEVIDRQLAHMPSNKVDRAYDRAQFLPERREMMQAWADYLSRQC